MTLDFLYIIIIVRYLRRTLKGSEHEAKWSSLFLNSMYVAIGLAVVSIVAHNVYITTPLILISEASLVALTWLLYSQPEFKTVKLLLIAILPYVIVSVLTTLIKWISFSFYNKWEDTADAISTFSVIWGLGVWLVIRNQNKELNKAKQKALLQEQNNKVISAVNDQLEIQVAQRTAELTKQKEELEHTLEELQSTQAQLIQSEKMASLGELTAGIAHEIQNPLNFVNNFSEVSAELLAEMKEEMKKGNNSEVELIADDLEKNLVRITQHGKRADAIVKSMLQHSRKNTGQLEPTNINALADEYLRLSYHGLRAKDKTFNAAMQTDFDAGIGTINIVPQDMGRVLLNLFNNAFYAVSEKKKIKDENYKPTIFVSTKKQGNEVIITVKDNGNGIPQTVIDKIFQPFYTTKPTGAGTGLGLSLSYDIVTRQHGGSIRAETKEGEGATFIVELPFK